MHDALFAGRCQSPEHRAADKDTTGSECQRLERIGAPAHSPIEQHFRAAVDGRDDLLERVERTGHTVELAAAVVRDDDGSGSVLTCEPRVLGGENSLHDHRKVVAGEPLEVTPAEPRVEVAAE